MSDETRIEPALSAEQWGEWSAVRARGGGVYDDAVGESHAICAYLIALNNAALPDDDPRKITRERLALLRHAVALASPNMESTPADQAELARIVDALESYLPPE